MTAGVLLVLVFASACSDRDNIVSIEPAESVATVAPDLEDNESDVAVQTAVKVTVTEREVGLYDVSWTASIEEAYSDWSVWQFKSNGDVIVGSSATLEQSGADSSDLETTIRTDRSDICFKVLPMGVYTNVVTAPVEIVCAT